MNSVTKFCATLFAVFAFIIKVASAAEPADDVLVETSQIRLTRLDYETALTRVPADLRDEFATDPRRLTLFLNNILITKTLAAQARQAGLEPDPEVLRDEPANLEPALAAAQLKAIEDGAARDFDARRTSFLATAREDYLIGKDKFTRPEQVRISGILISREGRGDDAALALARATREKLVSGFDFAALAKQVSEDKSSASEGGSLPWASANQMHRAVAKVAFGMPRIGDISEPIETDKSYTIIRLDERRPAMLVPFDDVKESILHTLRANHIRTQREAKLLAIRNDPTMKVNQPALDALVRKIDPKALKPMPDLPDPETAPPK